MSEIPISAGPEIIAWCVEFLNVEGTLVRLAYTIQGSMTASEAERYALLEKINPDAIVYPLTRGGPNV